MTPEMVKNKQRALVWYAKTMIGLKEEGPNKGQMIERFQKVVDGKAEGEAWCAAFVQFCIAGVDALFGELDFTTEKHAVFKSELATDLWFKSPIILHRTSPEPGMIAVWQRIVDGKPSWQGHTGIVVESVPLEYTVEGNTSSGGTGSQREGDGVFLRARLNGEISGFKLLGYVAPWGRGNNQ